MHVLHQANTVLLQSAGCRFRVGGFEVEVEMFTVFHEIYRRVLFVNQFYMKQLTTGTNAGVKILVLKFKC